MRTRLLLLDFILANQEFAYFETEPDKVNFFCNELGISKDCLPAKVYEGATPDQQTIRYFVDKFPLFFAPPFPGAPPVVTFSYIDSGFERRSTFASHLATYGRLFQQLKSFRFMYIAAKEAYFLGTEDRFRSLIKRPLETDWSNEVLKYFKIRKKWENHEYIIPVTEDLEFLTNGRERFRGNASDSFYQSWRKGWLSEYELRAELSLEKPEQAIFFETYLMNGLGPSPSEFAEQGDRCIGKQKPIPRQERESGEPSRSDRTSHPNARQKPLCGHTWMPSGTRHKLCSLRRQPRVERNFELSLTNGRKSSFRTASSAERERACRTSAPTCSHSSEKLLCVN
jgi:hypothetical protein